MYVLEENFRKMYDYPLPSLPSVRVREHVRCVDIRQTATVAGRMDVRAVTMDNRTVMIQTTGDMTIGEIVDKVCEELEK